MPDVHRAAVMPGPERPVEIREFRTPDLEPGAALLQTRYSEVCGTDVHLYHGRLTGVPYPIIPGHVSVGTLAALRGTLRDVDGTVLREGDIVTFLDVHETCHACWYCLVAKQTTRCPERKVYGITYGVEDGLLGGWSEAIWMKPGVRIIRLPPGVAPEVFIGGGCGLVTALHAVDLAGIRLGESVAVLGVGPVGQSAVAFSALSGAGEVIAVGDPTNRRDLALRMGATVAIDLGASPEERAAEVHSLTGHGADVVIEASGDPAAVGQALDLVRDGGRIVVAGQYTDGGNVHINPHRQINAKHVTVHGCWGSDYSHFHRAVDLVARYASRIPWRELASRPFTLDQAGEALAAVERREVVKAVLAFDAS